MQSISNSRPQFPPSISAHPFFSGPPLLLRNPLVGRNVERCAAHVPEHHKACHTCGQNTQWFPNSYTSIFETRWTTSDSNDVFGSRIGSKMPKQHSNESKVPLLFCLWLWVAWASCLHHLMVALEPQSIAPIYLGNTSGPFPTWTTAFLSFFLSSSCSFLFSFFSIHWSSPVTTPVSATLHQHSCSQATSRKRRNGDMTSRSKNPPISLFKASFS